MYEHQNASCIEACLACAVACRESAHQFGRSPGRAQCVQCCLECANQCVTCFSDLRNNSPLLVYSSRMCAEACDHCADEWSRHNCDHINRCEAACRVCADECRSVRSAIGKMVLQEG